jgi:predicted DNA-binding transcriptional regulator YafY
MKELCNIVTNLYLNLIKTIKRIKGMNYTYKAKAMERLLGLINEEKTGPAEDLSQRMCVSVPTLNRFLSELRELGYIVEYSRTRQTYFLNKK